MQTLSRIHVIDSHTGGEPTRVVVVGGPNLGQGSLVDRLNIFRTQYDGYRSAIVNEPRGSDVIVGAMLLPPQTAGNAVGVLFFNNAGYLGMCGHGTIGVVETLLHLDMIAPGDHVIETAVGNVKATLHPDGEVSVRNVPSYRYRADVEVNVEGIGTVRGDVAYGGNWFFLVSDHGQELTLANVPILTDYTRRVREALKRGGITGKDGAEIDHIELFAPSEIADSRNFVLCPGSAYDRSPCGTGTSAKLACLYADGKLKTGEVWKQESITSSVFEGSVAIEGEFILPTIRGRAYITAESSLILNPKDPLCWGINSMYEYPS